MLYCTYPFGENTTENLLFYKKEITLQVDTHSNIKVELHLNINPFEKEG